MKDPRARSEPSREGRATSPTASPGITEVALAVPIRGGRVLVARRPEGTHLAGHWEFPGGGIEAGEEPASAARRELREETGLDAPELQPLVVVVHEYPGRPLRLHVFVAPDPRGEVRVRPAREWAWMSLRELREVRMPEANGPILRALGWRLAE